MTAKNKYMALYVLSIVVAVLTLISMYLVAQNQELSAQIQEVDDRTSDISVSENFSVDLSLRVKELEERIVDLEKQLGIATDKIVDLDLTWEEEELSSTLRTAEWQIIKQEYSGIWPGLSLETKSANCLVEDRPQEYLYSEGGLCQSIFWVTGSEGAIYNEEELQEYLGKIDSAAKAAAYVNLTTANVDRDASGKSSEPKVLLSGDFYYVWVTQTNEFGCGVDLGEPKDYIYQVSATGDKTLVASKPQRELANGEPVICVD